jgi:mannosyl-oligosaccharide alpha-1,2-mannosidase
MQPKFLFLLLSFVFANDARVISKSSQPGLLVTQGGEDPDPVVNQRREFIKQMMKDAWDDYVRYAWGENELKPISQTGQDGGIYGDSKIGATIIDSLDTLFIMGYNDEYKKGRDWVAQNFDFSTVNTSVSLFETNIRIVGGFLTAYALTGDTLYVNQAYDVGKRLLPAFDTPSGFPMDKINPATGATSGGSTISMAGLGTLHLEFVYLSEVTGDPIFAEKVGKIRQNLWNLEKPNGLYPNSVNIQTGRFAESHTSMGGGADSFYEYLLKSWIQTQDRQARQMYDETMDAFVSNDLIRTSKQSHLLYIAEIFEGGRIEDIGSHLECFAGGMFALGSFTDPKNPADGNHDRDMEIGQNFTNTCHESYIRSATRIGPETFRFTDTAEAVGVNEGDKYYILRPEVIESYFILYRLTKDPKYRDWGWDAAQAIQNYTKAGPGRGYSGLRNVYSDPPVQDDVQQTFFLAETLKYLYLLFSTSDLIDLDNWVFNTECHPLPIKGRNPMF